jgi:hypothetical protein
MTLMYGFLPERNIVPEIAAVGNFKKSIEDGKPEVC